jgi:hypothetical protein
MFYDLIIAVIIWIHLGDGGFGSNVQLMVCWTIRIAEARNQKTATGRILFVCAGMLPTVVMEMLWNIAPGGQSGQFSLA